MDFDDARPAPAERLRPWPVAGSFSTLHLEVVEWGYELRDGGDLVGRLVAQPTESLPSIAELAEGSWTLEVKRGPRVLATPQDYGEEAIYKSRFLVGGRIETTSSLRLALRSPVLRDPWRLRRLRSIRRSATVLQIKRNEERFTITLGEAASTIEAMGLVTLLACQAILVEALTPMGAEGPAGGL